MCALRSLAIANDRIRKGRAMRTTDSRHQAERERFDLAIRMIGHRARRSAIELCTGLSPTRIRRLYQELRYKPKRGRLPRCCNYFTTNTLIQSEATLLAVFLCAAHVIRLTEQGTAERAEKAWTLLLGHRFCDAFESYEQVVAQPHISFERAWYFLKTLEKHELEFASCRRCRNRYVRESIQVDNNECPQCKLKKSPSASRESQTRRAAPSRRAGQMHESILYAH
jgi:hypothetical protein